jgi:hypothetical protein
MRISHAKCLSRLGIDPDQESIELDQKELRWLGDRLTPPPIIIAATVIGRHQEFT